MTDTRTATPWDVDSLMSLDIRRHVTDDILAVINTPHDHESPDTNRPIWIIWSLKPGEPPQIDTLCDTADSAVYHYGALRDDQSRNFRDKNLAAFVERVPANHRFASSIAHQVFDMGVIGKVKVPRRYRQGD